MTTNEEVRAEIAGEILNLILAANPNSQMTLNEIYLVAEWFIGKFGVILEEEKKEEQETN